MKVVVLLLLVVLAILHATAEENARVKTGEGVFQGSFLYSSPNKDKFSSFQGIPYAKPPVGQLRFAPPVAISSFHSWPQPATEPGMECVQLDLAEGLTRGGEDCLVLNVYTPVTDFTEEPTIKYPVMVWIHGGGFQRKIGSNEMYGPERLVEYGVVVVTVNYRLGPLGFLSTGDSHAPPNIGLLDQRMALRWVNRNIQHFGGNNEKVTLFGQSAGGMSVMYHMVSPGSQGLFHSAISMSGVFGDHALLHHSKPPQAYAKILADQVGCEGINDSKLLVDCLRKVDAELLVQKAKMFKIFQWLPEPFTPVMDSFMAEPVVLGPPAEVWNNPDLHTVPLIVGANKDEGIFSVMDFLHPVAAPIAKYSDVQQKFATLGPVLLFGVDEDVAEFDESEIATAEILRQSYLGGDDKFEHAFNGDLRTNITALLTDVHMLSPIDTVVRSLAKTPGPVYYYNYQHEGSLTLPMALGLRENLGVCQFDEMFLLWKSKKAEIPGVGDFSIQTLEDEVVSEKLLQMWTDFAKTGNPTPDGSWKSVQESGKIEYAVVDSEPLRMEYPENFNKRMELVQNIQNLANMVRAFDPEDSKEQEIVMEQEDIKDEL